MRIAILKHLQNLEAMVDRLDRKPIMLLDIDAFDPVDRDAYLDGDDSILTKYGFEPSPSHLAAIVISTHPAQRESWDEISDLDKKRLERVERQQLQEERRRARERVEREQLAAILATRDELPSAPGNAYSSDSE